MIFILIIGILMTLLGGGSLLYFFIGEEFKWPYIVNIDEFYRAGNTWIYAVIILAGSLVLGIGLLLLFGSISCMVNGYSRHYYNSTSSSTDNFEKSIETYYETNDDTSDDYDYDYPSSSDSSDDEIEEEETNDRRFYLEDENGHIETDFYGNPIEYEEDLRSTTAHQVDDYSHVIDSDDGGKTYYDVDD